MNNTPQLIFRNATVDDLDKIVTIENVCFSQNEAASRDSFSKRLLIFPNHFWLLEVDGVSVGYINGMVTDHSTINDEMFEHADLHDENGQWQSIFGIAVLPEYRKNGYAGTLINYLIDKARAQSRVGVTLTCKEYLTAYYQKFGFKDLGGSKSVHGGEVWHDMILELT